MDTPPGDKSRSKAKRRCVATARTSGLAESFYRKKREKREQLEEEMEIKKRAREERMRVFKQFGLDYCSDDGKSSEDEWIEIFKVNEEPPKEDSDGETKVKVKKKVTFEEKWNQVKFVESSHNVTDPKYDMDYLFVKKEDPLPPNDHKIKAPDSRNDIDNLFVKKEDPLPSNDRKIRAPDSRNDIDNLFVKKEDSPPSNDRKTKASADSPKENNAEEITKAPIRRTLYRGKDSRSNGPNSILQCKLCLEQGEMFLFSSEDALKSHLSEEHAFTYDWIKSFC